MADNPHDKLFKLVYGRPMQAAAYFERFLPAEVVARLDLERLELADGSFVDEELKEHHTDLLFVAPIIASDPAPDDEEPPRDALLYLLFEHQSTVDRMMPFRLLRYMVRIWERWQGEHPAAVHLPPIIPVVLYQGERDWQAAKVLPDMVPDAAGALGRFVPRFDVLFTCLRELSDAELATIRDGVSRLLLMVFRHGRDANVLTHLPRWAAELLEAQVLQLLGGFIEYLLSVQDPLDLKALGSSLRKTLNPRAESTAMTVAEKLIEQGREQGREGTLRQTLQRQLTLRFGPLPEWAVRTIEEAGSDTLEWWLERVISVESLEGVFAS